MTRPSHPSTPWPGECLRVVLLAGTLRQGGAEKQAVYMARALLEVGVDVRVYSLTRGEHHESRLHALGIEPRWIGKHSHPLARLAALVKATGDDRPHIIQACHFFASPYAMAVARIRGALSFGSLRNDFLHEMGESPSWGRWALRLPSAVIANSEAARRNAEAHLGRLVRIHVVPNVIDLEDFDAGVCRESRPDGGRPVAIAVGSLLPAKRFDRFLVALARARREAPELVGILIGDGPERANLETLAEKLGLLPDAITFAGRRDDIPGLLAGASMLVLSSDHEGFPNVVMEALAARLPVVATPAGDAGTLVEHDRSGFVVPFEDIDEMAGAMARLAKSPELRREFGEAGRARIGRDHAFGMLRHHLLSAYRSAALARRDSRLIALIDAAMPANFSAAAHIPIKDHVTVA